MDRAIRRAAQQIGTLQLNTVSFRGLANPCSISKAGGAP